MTCRDCIEEGTATGGPCTEPRHQAGPRFVHDAAAPGPECRHDDVRHAGTLVRDVPSAWRSDVYEFPDGEVTVVVGDCVCRAAMYQLEVQTSARRIRTRWVAEESDTPTGPRPLDYVYPPDQATQLWAALLDRTDERDRARRWAVALEQECARLADQVRVLTAQVSVLCDATGLDPAILTNLTDVALAAARATEPEDRP